MPLILGYYKQLLSGKAQGVFTSCVGVSLNATGAVASTAYLNLTDCIFCANVSNNIVQASIDLEATYMWIPDILIVAAVLALFGIAIQMALRERLSWDLLSRNVLATDMYAPHRMSCTMPLSCLALLRRQD